MWKRAAAMTATAGLILILGCGRSYEDRLAKTIQRLQYQERLDRNLEPAAQGKFKDLSVFIRPPKPLQAAQAFGLTDNPGQFDLSGTFLGVPKADGTPAKKEGEAEAEAAPAEVPLRLHVMARVKKAKKTTKKGEPPPPEPATPRGDFTADVRALIANDLPGEQAGAAALKNDNKRDNAFKRLIYSAANGDSIRAYFYKVGDHEVALVFDIPPPLDKSKKVENAITLALESFAAGPKAVRRFASESQGGDDEEAAATAAGGGGPSGTAAPGPAF